MGGEDEGAAGGGGGRRVLMNACGKERRRSHSLVMFFGKMRFAGVGNSEWRIFSGCVVVGLLRYRRGVHVCLYDFFFHVRLGI